MGRVSLAFRAFFGVLFGTIGIEPMRTLLTRGPGAVESPGAPPNAPPTAPASQPGPVRGTRPVEPTRPRRSEAITLLAALQREARFVDLVQEPLHEYSDQQIGAAARDVLRDCRQVLTRMFALQPVSNESENAQVETPADLGQGRWRVTGKVQGEPPFRGRLVHHGWEAGRCELPQWTGGADANNVIAPAEVEC